MTNNDYTQNDGCALKAVAKFLGFCMIAYVALIALNVINGNIGFFEVGVVVSGVALAVL